MGQAEANQRLFSLVLGVHIAYSRSQRALLGLEPHQDW